MRVWENSSAWGIDHMQRADRTEPAPPGAGQVTVRLQAATTNFRDVLLIGEGAPGATFPYVPLSDAAGEVIAVGAGVTRVKVGDRVCPLFYRDWLSGPPTINNRTAALASAHYPGVLQDVMVFDEACVSLFAPHLNYLEAATLPCAALTAWSAIEAANVQAEDVVVVQGTGGVSMFALQFAKLRGALVIATSSSAEKLGQARALGADYGVNYRETPKWGKAVLEFTQGRGADHIIDVGGTDTIAQSITAAAFGATIVLIGVLTGKTQELLVSMVCFKHLHITGVSVGSREQFEAMNAAIAQHHLRPTIGAVYSFGEAREALAAQRDGRHFGKIAIDYSMP